MSDSDMASTEFPILVEQSFKAKNDQIRRNYLDHGCLWMAENLWPKYKQWYFNKYGEQFVDSFCEESENDSNYYISLYILKVKNIPKSFPGLALRIQGNIPK